MNKKDYYEVLGVSKSATDVEIKSAFRRLAKQYHPDINKETGAADKFKEIQEAYAVLSDENKRRQYDQYGHAAFDNNMGGAGFDFQDMDLSDILGDLLGRNFGFEFGRGSSNRKTKGRDSIMRISLSFDEAVHGCKKTINIDTLDSCTICNGKGGTGEKKCPTCHGAGQVTAEQRTIFGSFATRTTCPTCKGKGTTLEDTCSKCRGTGKIKVNKDIEVTIPAGVNNGNQLRLAGKGEAGNNGGPNGDLYLEFSVKSHPLFQREDSDVYIDLPINIVEATLGCKKEIPTIYGNVTLIIPEGTQSGDKHRLKGKGVENPNNGKKGDMYAIINVIIPRKLSRDQKKIFDELKKTDLDDSIFDKFESYLD